MSKQRRRTPVHTTSFVPSVQRWLKAITLGGVTLAAWPAWPQSTPQPATQPAPPASQRATAAQLAAAASDTVERAPDLALLLAVEAARLARDAGERVPRAAHEVLRRAADPLSEHAWGSEPAVGLAALSQGAQHVVVAREDRNLYLGELGSRAPQLLAMGRADAVVTALNAVDDRLLSGADDGSVWLWNLARPTDAVEMLGGHEMPVTAVALSADGRWALSGDRGGVLQLTDLVGEARESRRLPQAHAQAISALAFTPDGRYLVSGDESGALRLWTLDPEDDPRVLAGPESGIVLISASPDSNWLVVGYQDGTVQAWDLAAFDGQPTLSGKLHTGAVLALAFAPDSRWAASGGSDGLARVFRLEQGPLRAARLAHEDAVVALAVSPDAKRLVTGSGDGSLRLWDLDQPREAPYVVSGHDAGLTGLAVTDDSRWLASVGNDAVRVWPLMDDDLLKQACRTARRNLTRAEWRRWFASEKYQRSCEEWPAGN